MALNWGLISDGGMFESLVHAILFQRDAGTLLFGRPGRDGAQDARSFDGSTVYQAKFKADGLNMDGAVRLALEELESIKRYKTQGHSNYKHWESVRNWRLIANIAINPNDDHKWKTKVAPKFASEGLVADCWPKERIEQEIYNYPEIADVFFEGENRVLVGLKEAHSLLSSEGVASSFEIPFLGRNRELKRIVEFVANSNKKILPIVGSVGIGKSRLLYESLVELAEQGWRTLWGLTSSMSRSSKWFRLLNGTQKTVVVLDGLEDEILLRSVMEQLATTERKNWKVIASCSEVNRRILDGLNKATLAEEAVTLEPLEQDDAKKLVAAWYKPVEREERDYQIYKLSNGVPGWITLVGASFRNDNLEDLPKTLDCAAELYVRSCLEKLSASNQVHATTVLRWLALWERLALTPDSQEYSEFQFLKSEFQIKLEDVRSILKDLTTTGLVKNYGVGKRYFSIGQLIVRQQVLTDWLFESKNYVSEISHDGIQLVKDLAHLKLPNPDATIFSLAQLSRSRLDGLNAHDFLGPVFKQLKDIARHEGVVIQDRVLDLIAKGGPADPELALEVLIETRKATKADEVVESYWGAHTNTHRELVSRIPWLLYCLSEFVEDYGLARRFLREFEALILNPTTYEELTAGKQPLQLLGRLLADSERLEVFGQPAFELAVGSVSDFQKWPFVKALAGSLLNPVHESTVWTASSTVSFRRSTVLPKGTHWMNLEVLRKSCFDVLEAAENIDQRIALWALLQNAHYALHRAAIQSKVEGRDLDVFDTVLLSDLQKTKSILATRGQSLEVMEATAARKMWEWYLRYGTKEEFVRISQDCEDLYRKLSVWNFQIFFSYDLDAKSNPERHKVADHLVNCHSATEIALFFEEAEQFLRASDRIPNGYDPVASTVIANKCLTSFSLSEIPNTPVSNFVCNFLRQSDFAGSEFTFGVVLKLIRGHLKGLKETKGTDYIAPVKIALGWSNDRGKLLEGIYTFPHRDNIGELHLDELGLLFDELSDWDIERQFLLLAPFLILDRKRVLDHLRLLLSDDVFSQKEKGSCILGFARVISTMSTWWSWETEILPVGWILDAIIDCELTGELLESYELNSIRERADYRLPISKLCSFIRSRNKFDQAGPPYQGFEIFPYDFKVSEWCGEHFEIEAFNELCELTQDRGFVATYQIPKWIACLDPCGTRTAEFVQQQLGDATESNLDALAQLSYLAASYTNDSDAWKEIAKPICVKSRELTREDREHLYSCLTNNSFEAYCSMPGEVAEQYRDAVRNAEHLVQSEPPDSPLRGYREWILENAKYQLKRERERVEEESHGRS